jgi:hypothetical protein
LGFGKANHEQRGTDGGADNAGRIERDYATRLNEREVFFGVRRPKMIIPMQITLNTTIGNNIFVSFFLQGSLRFYFDAKV